MLNGENSGKPDAESENKEENPREEELIAYLEHVEGGWLREVIDHLYENGETEAKELYNETIGDRDSPSMNHFRSRLNREEKLDYLEKQKTGKNPDIDVYYSLPGDLRKVLETQSIYS